MHYEAESTTIRRYRTVEENSVRPSIPTLDVEDRPTDGSFRLCLRRTKPSQTPPDHLEGEGELTLYPEEIPHLIRHLRYAWEELLEEHYGLRAEGGEEEEDDA